MIHQSISKPFVPGITQAQENQSELQSKYSVRILHQTCLPRSIRPTPAIDGVHCSQLNHSFIRTRHMLGVFVCHLNTKQQKVFLQLLVNPTQEADVSSDSGVHNT